MQRELKLKDGETLVWEARPAPRCYTFRHWRHSIFGVIFLLICCVWQVLGFEMAAEYDIAWLKLLPLPFVVIGIYFSVGHLLQARLEWNNVRYLITDKRLIALRGLTKRYEQTISLTDLTYLSLRMQGEQLGTLRVHAGKESSITLHCLEHPQRPTALLEEAIKDNRGEGCNDGSRRIQGIGK